LGGFGLDSYQIYAPMPVININANPTPKNALRNAKFFQFLIISSDIYAPHSTQHYRFSRQQRGAQIGHTRKANHANTPKIFIGQIAWED
jgi:hypothetical protein